MCLPLHSDQRRRQRNTNKQVLTPPYCFDASAASQRRICRRVEQYRASEVKRGVLRGCASAPAHLALRHSDRCACDITGELSSLLHDRELAYELRNRPSLAAPSFRLPAQSLSHVCYEADCRLPCKMGVKWAVCVCWRGDDKASRAS
jgi:hypothetical protein